MKNVILCGDVREQLRLLDDESVNCCVTSPPYWGLRDYGTASWEGGDEGHAHAVQHERTGAPGSAKQASSTGANSVRSGDCECGAVRIDSQLGLEATPEEYVANMVAVFREVRRVLRKDGTLWLNLGDSYAHTTATLTPHNGALFAGNRQDGGGAAGEQYQVAHHTGRAGLGGLKPKDLVGIPWRVAFALQADGWWLRSDIIWSKPNPMPESVTDRPTKAHEYLFLLTKSERYYYDGDAIQEKAIHEGRVVKSYQADAKNLANGDNDVNDRRTAAGFGNHDTVVSGRNKRTVWEIATEPYPDAHFATFPTALVKPCILAGCPEGGVVLDPFFGSGTTGLVAKLAGRDYIGIELNPAYVALAEKRIRVDQERML